MTAVPKIRPLTLSETHILVAWARDEGWNPGDDDYTAFYAADPNGFIGCFVSGQLVAGISAVAYSDNFGFIGLYICHPDYRGKGYGLKVWNAGMAHLAGRTIGLDGVPEQQANYQKMGFAKSYETARWSGRLNSIAQEGDRSARSISIDDFENLATFDRVYFPADRPDFLRAWAAKPRHCFVVTDGPAISGYAVLRPCAVGYKIGPLFARTMADTKALLSACADMSGDDEIQIDVPSAQSGFIAYLLDLGFAQGFETARMYLGNAPDIDMTGIYAITTLELG